MSKIRFVGLDVHAETIAVAVAEAGGEVRSHRGDPEPVGVDSEAGSQTGPGRADLKACYEAGPTGYVLYWQLTQLGVACEVIAPSLVPTKAGDRVKTDRRDAEKLARCYRAGELTAVWVPDAAHEALRDLVRAREAAKKDQLKARHRLGKFLLRHGRSGRRGSKPGPRSIGNGSRAHVHFEQAALEATLADYLEEVDHVADTDCETGEGHRRGSAAGAAGDPGGDRSLQALRGVAQTTAATIVSELGSLSRFQSPRQLMGYSGLVATRTHQREPGAARRHHQNRQRSSQTGSGGSGVGVSASAQCDQVSWLRRQKNLAHQRRSQDRSPGRRSSGCTNATKPWRRAAKTRTRS